MEKIKKVLFSPALMAILLLLYAFFAGFATIIENDHGAAYARQVVYNARWFELIQFFLVVNLAGSIFTRRLYKKEKFSVFLFHFSFVIIMFGAALTRYVGYEGIMHIREKDKSNTIVTELKGVGLSVTDGETVTHFNYDANFDNSSKFSKTVKWNDQKAELSLDQFLPIAVPQLVDDAEGAPTITLVVATNGYRGPSFITAGEQKQFGNLSIGLNIDPSKGDIVFTTTNDSLYVQSHLPIMEGAMSENMAKVIVNQKVAVNVNQLLQIGKNNLVVQEYKEKAKIVAGPANGSNVSMAKKAAIFRVNYMDKSELVTVWETRGRNTLATEAQLGDKTFEISYGAMQVKLPFEIYLDDFVIDRYPGSNSPSSFSSHITIQDPGAEPQPFHIYMNNILKKNGYRFFQSSYDDDEKGTILQVNYDIWGTTVTYIGYFLMVLGIIWSMINKNTFFRSSSKLIKKSAALLIIGLMGFGQLKAQNKPQNIPPVSVEHAKNFGSLLIQNSKGRTMPINTFSSDLIRKISRKEKFMGLTPVQVFLEMNTNPGYWMNVPMIKVSNKELQKKLGVKTNYAAYNDFLSPGVGYKLQQAVSAVYAKAPAERNKYDKELIKVDERLNICYAIYSGDFMRIFPVQGSELKKWETPDQAYLKATSSEDSLFLANIIPVYYKELERGRMTDNYKQADEYVKGIATYQRNFADYELPSQFKINTELKYYEWNVFKKLFPIYFTLGVVYLLVLLVSIVVGGGISVWLKRGFTTLFILAFAAHTIGLAVRWYISGHAPMSNGYESMIFISWVTILAGFIFNKQSEFALPATGVLAGMTLMVANLSFMDPEITNLVPVLKSYWLTIHVSVITGSYGFLGLGFIIGLVNLLLMTFKNMRNKVHVDETINSLSLISNRTLTVGLYLLTIGTFLGAVWANESWGRYWGWDPKETWSLITIIVYTLVTHARMIPGLKGLYAFNLLSVFAFSSVLMTYFGVNYYLSGMHSYGAGDPIPVPTFVYYSIAILISISIAAYFKNKKVAN